jgi:S1-C subfamily serine protease
LLKEAMMAASEPLDAYSQIVTSVAEQLAPKVASLRVPRRGPGENLGSAVVYTNDGFLLTNAHVVGQATGGTAAFWASRSRSTRRHGGLSRH